MGQYTVEKMKEMWGGHLPTREDFKVASKQGRIRADKTIAAKAIYMKGMPKPYFILYGVITIWVGFLLVPTTLAAWFFMRFSGWWVIGSVCLAWFLIKVSREGHCDGMIQGAENSEELYKLLLNSGAFLFGP